MPVARDRSVDGPSSRVHVFGKGGGFLLPFLFFFFCGNPPRVVSIPFREEERGNNLNSSPFDDTGARVDRPRNQESRTMTEEAVPSPWKARDFHGKAVPWFRIVLYGEEEGDVMERIDNQRLFDFSLSERYIYMYWRCE